MAGQPNPYATDRNRLEWYARFSLTPVDPAAIQARLDGGETLDTMDLPTYLSQQALTDCETGVGLYRLVQLWGTPNVPGRVAGAIEADRSRTTWQYLFDVSYDRGPDDDPAVPERFLLSVYDYKTDISAGLSRFVEPSSSEGSVDEPHETGFPADELPPDPFLTGVVGLVLNMVDEAVPATFKELWV